MSNSNNRRKWIIAGIVAAAAVILVACSVWIAVRNSQDEVSSETDALENEITTEDTLENSDADDKASDVDVGALDDPEDPQSEERTGEGEGASINVEELFGNDFAESGLTLGIDVSKWQGEIDWEAVAAAGVDFAMIRIGYRTTDTGEICEDPYARYNLQEARDAGVMIGVYFFSTAVTEEEALEEAAWVTEFIAQYPITYPVAYNCEGFTDAGSRMYSITAAERTQYVLAFLNYVKDAGYTAMMYAPKNDLEDASAWLTEKIEATYPVWVAHYTGTSYEAGTAYEGRTDMWQYTNKGTVNGISGSVDLNVAYFGYTQVASPKSSEEPEEVTAPYDTEAGVTFERVNEQVTAKDVTNLRSEPSTDGGDDTVVIALKSGEWVTRTGIGTNGWSRVEYNGQTLYAVSSYLYTEEEYAQAQAETTATGTDQNNTDATDQTTKQTETTTSDTVLGVTFQTVNEQVTAKDETNLRSEPSTDGGSATVVVTLKNGEWVTRTGIGDNGWSRVEYHGQTLYAVTSYLTTDENYTTAETQTVPNVVYTEVNDKVTPKIETNLRSEPSTTGGDATIVATVSNGEVLTRIGIGTNGWSKIEYNGQTVYAVTSLLEEVE